jgi:septum formation protein
MLLQRLGLHFECHSPEIDETVSENEAPAELVSRLAVQKAKVISDKHPQAVVIGSDQIAIFKGRIIGKPGSYPAALEQLTAFSGNKIEFLTAVSVQSAENNFTEQYTDTTRVAFRTLQRGEIERYLDREKPFDCAGSFKAESLGIVLFEQISSEDPTALIGLPLIRTSQMLRRAGLQLP